MQEHIYNKLVRDNIPEITQKSGGNPIFHIADNAGFREKLKEKLFEEIDEFFEDKNENEMADILEALYALGKEYSINFGEVEKVRQEKLQKVGGFKKRIILEKVIGGYYKS